MNCLSKLEHPKLTLIHRGKVRDSFRVDANTRMIVVTDRISAFNMEIKTPIPNKGAILNEIANYWFKHTQDIIPNHFIQQIDPNITLVKEAKPILLEMVVRGYLAGSMWRAYEKGVRVFSGVTVPNGMYKNQKFAQAILTPTVKSATDEAISEEEIANSGLLSAEQYKEVKEKARALFSRGTTTLAKRGVILVDTKYEFGFLDGALILIDEVHTPDSSRFWRAQDYATNPSEAKQIDKEFLRLWLIANKKEGQYVNVLSKNAVAETSKRYTDFYELLMGKKFEPRTANLLKDIEQNLKKAGILGELPKN